MPTKTTLSHADRIAQCKQQAVNDWEGTFLSSILLYINGGKFAGLSDKQESKLQDIEKAFNLSRYYNEDGTKPYNADVADMRVIKVVAPSAWNDAVARPKKQSNPYDDMDDDIPF